MAEFGLAAAVLAARVKETPLLTLFQATSRLRTPSFLVEGVARQ
jgi:hypothetical protein